MTDNLKHRITTATGTVDHYMLVRVWGELSYRTNVGPAAGGVRIENL